MSGDTPMPEIARDALVAVARRLKRRQSLEIDGKVAIAAIAGFPLRHFVRDASEVSALAEMRRWGQTAPPRRLFATWDNSERAQLLRWPWLGWLFIFHGDGYLRESALRGLNGPAPGAFLLAQLLYRLNDWVPEVRAAARACVARVAAATPPDIVAQVVVALLDRTSEWRRWNDSQAVMDELLTRDDVARAIAELLAVSVTGPHARALRQAMRAGAIDPYLDRLATDAIQPAVRAVAVKTLIDGIARWPAGWTWQWIDKSLGERRRVREIVERPLLLAPDRGFVIERAAGDPSAAVRFTALEGALRYVAESAVGARVAARLANDPVPRVQARARFILSTHAPLKPTSA